MKQFIICKHVALEFLFPKCMLACPKCFILREVVLVGQGALHVLRSIFDEALNAMLSNDKCVVIHTMIVLQELQCGKCNDQNHAHHESRSNDKPCNKDAHGSSIFQIIFHIS